MKAPVHLVCACNSGYIIPLTVMLASVVDHFSRERQLIIHALSSDASPKQKADVQESIRMIRPDATNITLKWYTMDSLNFSVKNPRHTMDVFSRLYAPALLPQEIERVLYLDCDLVVLKDISGLYDAGAGSPALLHCIQSLTIPTVSSPQGVFDYKERGIPADAPYFNSGVMLMNFPLWRQLDMTKPLIDYIIENGPKVGEADQGALNALCWDKWEKLDQHWNTHASLNVAENRAKTGLSQAQWTDLRLNPWLVHFTGDKKPWNPGHVFPRYSYFYNYLQRTVYKDSYPNRPKLEHYLGVRLYYHVWNFLRRLPRRGGGRTTHYEESNAT